MTDARTVWSGAAWRAGVGYARRGLASLRREPLAVAAIMLLFALPAAGVIAITAADLPQGLGRTLATLALNTLAGTVAPVMFMKVVAAAHHGSKRGLAAHLRDGAVWLPRYIWTNLHTTVIFWVPVGALTLGYLGFRQLDAAQAPLGTLVSAAWIAAIAVTGIYVHTRTLLAPFLAVHGNIPGSLAALESWRLSGRYFGPVFAAFAVSAAPTALPLTAVFMAVYLTLEGRALDVFTATLTAQVWIAIKLIRPPLVAAAYALYEQLWPAEQARRRREGHPPTPAAVRLLVRLSWIPPRLAGFAFRRPVSGPL